ncbi:MAG: hypothetical protein IT458_03185 [Planctomycetes bacterium]|nr:hypothetical protein [Planctomycetota bacterium]
MSAGSARRAAQLGLALVAWLVLLLPHLPCVCECHGVDLSGTPGAAAGGTDGAALACTCEGHAEDAALLPSRSDERAGVPGTAALPASASAESCCAPPRGVRISDPPRPPDVDPRLLPLRVTVIQV